MRGSATGPRASLRLSIGADTTDDQIERAAVIVADAISRLRTVNA
jgi:cysteine sulfinate desulfinase/cysteine desulfurase-like protein